MPGLEPGHRFRDGCLSRALRYHYSTSAWRRTQDSNLQVVSDQLFSRPFFRKSPPYTAYFGAPHGTRTRTRKSELPPQDSVSTKFHQGRIFCFKIGSRWIQTPCHLPYRSGIASVLPYDLLPKAISRSYLINAI